MSTDAPATEEKRIDWKEILIPPELVGESITKGDGYYKKEYRYIKLPDDYGYNGYVFLISEKLVTKFDYLEDMYYFVNICDNMTFELFYNPQLREDKKRYKRWKLTAHELFEQIIEPYADKILQKEYSLKQAEKFRKDKRDKSIVGTIICGRYIGNVYGAIYEEYKYQNYLSAFLKSDGGTYSNHKFTKVQNVKREFTVINNITKYHFLLYEELINAYIGEYETYANIKANLENQLIYSMKHDTGTDDIIKTHIESCNQAMKEIKERLLYRLTDLLKPV